MTLLEASVFVAAVVTVAAMIDRANAAREKASPVPVRVRRVPRVALVLIAFTVALVVTTLAPIA